ncbi:MAG: Multi antimicrobial extrusion protein [Deltaproteobacteria bacterium]|nr:Multi antimicrobial extrusion protein [Deltaproteobacteria bacterium]
MVRFRMGPRDTHSPTSVIVEGSEPWHAQRVDHEVRAAGLSREHRPDTVGHVTARAQGEARALIWLAVPLVVQELGYQALSFLDMAMLGSFGGPALGGAGLGNIIFFTFVSLGTGCIIGMDALVARAFGAGKPGQARHILRQAIRLAVYLSVICSVLVYGAVCLLPTFGVQQDIADAARQYVTGRIPSVLPFFVFIAQRSYLQAKGLTRPIVIAMLVVVVVNLIAAALFIYGDRALLRVGLPELGLPELGAFGSGLAVSVAAPLWVLVLGAAIRVDAVPASVVEDPDTLRHIVRLGVPIGLQLVAEIGIWSLFGVLAGRLSVADSTANQIGIVIESLSVTCISWSISTAVAVRVGRSIGTGDIERARYVGALGMRMAIIATSCLAAVLLLVAGPLSRVFSDDPATLEISSSLLVAVGICQIADGAQLAGVGALRGIGDTRASFLAVFVGHYGVSLPLALLLCFGLGFSTLGMWWGITMGLALTAIVIAARFARLCALGARIT